MSTPKAEDLKIYEVFHRDTGEKRFSASSNAEDACNQVGWLIGNCFVIEQKPISKSNKGKDPTLLVKIPCEVCPYQYGECRKPPAADCPVRRPEPELTDWLRQATQARLCPHTGTALSRKDYQLCQKWVTIAQAVLELTPKATLST